MGQWKPFDLLEWLPSPKIGCLHSTAQYLESRKTHTPKKKIRHPSTPTTSWILQWVVGRRISSRISNVHSDSNVINVINSNSNPFQLSTSMTCVPNFLQQNTIYIATIESRALQVCISHEAIYREDSSSFQPRDAYWEVMFHLLSEICCNRYGRQLTKQQLIKIRCKWIVHVDWYYASVCRWYLYYEHCQYLYILSLT